MPDFANIVQGMLLFVMFFALDWVALGPCITILQGMFATDPTNQAVFTMLAWGAAIFATITIPFLWMIKE